MIKRKLGSPTSCRQCKKTFCPRMDSIKRGCGIFCSISCFQSYRNRSSDLSKELLIETYHQERSLRRTAKALHTGWRQLYKRMKEFGIDTSPSALRRSQTYGTCWDSNNGIRRAIHLVVVEKKYGRRIQKGEVTHHLDVNRQNNSPENLVILTQQRHAKVHKQLEQIALKLFKKGLVLYKEHDGYIISPEMEVVLGGQ